MEFTHNAPQWDAQGTQPTQAISTDGFTAGYKPPASYFNYLFNNYTACIDEIQEVLGNLNDLSDEEFTELENALQGYLGGKNVLSYETLKEGSANASMVTVAADGSVTINNTTTATVNIPTNDIKLEAGTYTFTVSSSAAGIEYGLFKNGVGMKHATTTAATESYTFTLTTRAKITLCVYVPRQTSKTAFYQIEQGESFTSFEKHTEAAADVLNTIKAGNSVTALGLSALKGNAGDDNTAVGYKAAEKTNTGEMNTAVGSMALKTNTTGKYNTAVGYAALSESETAGYNTGLGNKAGQFNRTGERNTNVGYNAGVYNIVGSNNTGVGFTALSNAKGSNNTGVGSDSLKATTTGENNTAVGATAAAANTTGGRNTALGKGALNSNTTGSDNTAVGYNANAANTAYSNTTALGANAIVCGSNEVQLGDSGTNVYAYSAVQTRSDSRDKRNITDTDLGLDFIKALTPRKFLHDYRDAYIEYVPVYDEDGEIISYTVIEHTPDGSKAGTRYHQGLIAQEVKQVADDLGVDFGGYQDHSINGGRNVITLGYEEFIAPLVKALQELDTNTTNNFTAFYSNVTMLINSMLRTENNIVTAYAGETRTATIDSSIYSITSRYKYICIELNDCNFSSLTTNNIYNSIQIPMLSFTQRLNMTYHITYNDGSTVHHGSVAYLGNGQIGITAPAAYSIRVYAL